MLKFPEQGLTILKTSAEDPIPASINATCRDQQSTQDKQPFLDKLSKIYKIIEVMNSQQACLDIYLKIHLKNCICWGIYIIF